MVAKLPPLPDLHGHINLQILRESLRRGLQKVFQEFNDSAVLLVDDSLHEPLVKSYLGTPEKAFEELGIPVAHCQALGPTGLDDSTRAVLPKHTHVVFLVHSSPSMAQLVAQYIHEIRRLHELSRSIASSQGASGPSAPGVRQVALGAPTFWVVLYPEAGLTVRTLLELANVTTVGDTNVREWPIHFFPYDRDLLNLHRPRALKQLLTDSNPAILHQVAAALLVFAREHGLPRRLQAVGRASVLTAELLRKAVKEHADSAGAKLQRVSMLKWVLFDRTTDMVTPLLSQLTMEGRLDELTNCAAGNGWLPGERDSDTDPNVRAINVLLHQSTPEWQDWRERHVQALPELQKRAAKLEQDRREAQSADQKWANANYLRYLQRPLHHLGRDLVDGLRPGGALPEHHQVEMDFLESRGRHKPMFGGGGPATADTLADLISTDAHFELCVRRLMLDVAMRGALPEAQFADCVALLLDVFGHQHVHTLTNMQAAGLLAMRTGGSTETESTLRAMRTLLDKAEQNSRGGKDVPPLLSHILLPVERLADPNGPGGGTPYGRYQPISALIISSALSRYMPTWVKKHLQTCARCQGQPSNMKDTFGSYSMVEQAESGCFVAERQDNEEPLGARTSPSEHSPGQQPVTAGTSGNASAPKPVVMVVMLGGCTLAELTALRKAKSSQDYRLVIMTTDILTGDRLVQSFMPDSTKLANEDAEATLLAL